MRLPTRLLRRRPDSHKGDFGHIFIIAGSLRFSGAAVLCAEGALRCGAGLVTMGIPRSIAGPLIKIKPKEAMLKPLPETKERTLSLSGYAKIKEFIRTADIVVAGPGLGQNKSTQALVRRIIASASKPVVIDADALNALAGHLNILRSAGRQGRTIILTPHPGEMARLLNVDIRHTQKMRKDIAKKFAMDYNVTLVLKGNKTVVAGAKGNAYLNPTGNPGMATAGSGDVLAGMIAAFLGQGLSAFDAAKYGVYLHGRAGDLAAKEKTQLGMIASDIIEKIPEAIKGCS